MGFGGVTISSILSSVGKSAPNFVELYGLWVSLMTFLYSLEKDSMRRATPWRMLEHPWMIDMKAKKVNMEHFLKQVWDWKD